jgi:C4-dicarboxylate-binding protein DctP
MYEVQSHLTMTEHGYLGYAVIVNKAFWDGLPVQIRKQLEQAMAESTKFANRIAKYRNNQDLEKLRKSGRTKIYYPSPTERDAFRQAMLPVHKEMAPRIGQSLLRAVYTTLYPPETVRPHPDHRRVVDDPLGALRHDPS